MAKNIVICCDGTGNEYGDSNTNVVKLFRILQKNSPQQVAYYDPGVGTFSLPGIFSKPAKKLSKLMGMAFGLGFTQNLEDAYRYLMQNYADGDQVYMFGFSRGAYTVRALAGMVHKCGLLTAGSENLIPYASKMYKFEKRKFISEGFKRTYSREVKVHFLGVWDTVKSLGNVYDPLTLSYTVNNPDVEIVRHAVSIDERRCFYRQNLWGSQPGQDVTQVWFAGVHSDVGGSYPEKESGLSKIALKWMADEARTCGLLLDQKEYDTVIPSAWVEGQEFVPPNHKDILHKSLKGLWWVLEFIPKMYQDMSKDPPRTAFRMYMGRRRFIPKGSIVHESVAQRMKDVPNYKPENLP